jgi:response regulator RpfG family c-di-GMP phosphodiesterase
MALTCFRRHCRISSSRSTYINFEKWSAAMPEMGDSKARLLIVDDEPEVRSVLHDFLCETHHCIVAGCAEEALALLYTGERFDLIVSDIAMSGMSGLELIPHALSLTPETVIIMISGTQTIENAIEALRAGAFDYIMKPFDLAHVEMAVQRALTHHGLLEAKCRYENYLEELVRQRTDELHQTLDSLEDSYRMTLKALVTALETRDTDTHGHSRRVVDFSLRLGRELSLDKNQMRALEFGALLHDIGKIGIPDAILRKPARLTDEEWVKMRQHPALGERILAGIKFLEGAARVVGQHHEKWDGSGYPLGLRMEEIDFNARIFAVVDAFDALTSDRVYRTGKSYELATAELERCKARHFDPEVVAAFHRVPREDWQALHDRSINRVSEKFQQTDKDGYELSNRHSVADNHIVNELAEKLQEFVFVNKRNLAA